MLSFILELNCSSSTKANAVLVIVLVKNKVLTNAQKDKEDLEEVTTELELADEDELVPCVLPFPYPF